MNENRPEDEPNPGPGGEPRSGLSVSREDTEGRSPPPRSRRRGTGTTDKLWQAAQADESIVAHWFLPLAGLVLVLLIVSVAMYFSHGSQLNALSREVATLRDQNIGTTSASEIEQAQARVAELTSQLGVVDELNAEIQALRDQLQKQNQRIETLAGRIEALEKTPASSAGTASNDSGDSSTQTEQVDAQTDGGQWVVNLITLGDLEAAESFQKRLNELGIKSRIEAITSGDKTLQRVVVPGFGSQEAAQQVVPELKRSLELSDDPWITRQSD